MRRIQVLLKEDQDELLKALARDRGQSKSRLIREAVGAYLVESVPAESDPLLELIGIADSAPGDLSERHDEVIVQEALREDGE